MANENIENIKKIDADLIKLSIYIQDYLVQIGAGAHIHNKSVSDQVSRFLIPYAETQLGFIAEAQEAGLKEVQVAKQILKLLTDNNVPQEEEIQDELNILHQLLHTPGRQIAGYNHDDIHLMPYNITLLIKTCTKITLLHNLCGHFSIIQNFVAQNPERIEREFPQLKTLTEEWLMAQFNAIKRIAAHVQENVGARATSSVKPFPEVGGEPIARAPEPVPIPDSPRPVRGPAPAPFHYGLPRVVPAPLPEPIRHGPDRQTRYRPWDGGYGGGYHGGYGRYVPPPPPPPRRRPWGRLLALLAINGIIFYGLYRYAGPVLGNIGSAMGSALSTLASYSLAPIAFAGKTLASLMGSGLSALMSLPGAIAGFAVASPILFIVSAATFLVFAKLFTRALFSRSHADQNDFQAAHPALADRLRQHLRARPEHQPLRHLAHQRPLRFEPLPQEAVDRQNNEPPRQRRRLR